MRRCSSVVMGALWVTAHFHGDAVVLPAVSNATRRKKKKELIERMVGKGERTCGDDKDVKGNSRAVVQLDMLSEKK